jgi:hypothetical protein
VEQAKALKAGRVFVQELEDIKDFEKKVVGGSEGCFSMKRLSIGKRGVTGTTVVMRTNLMRNVLCMVFVFSDSDGCRVP